MLQMIEKGATHLGVATDHVIESFRNELWPDYKTGEGIEPALLAQFHPLEEALATMGVAVWPMIELEADDALASAARLATNDARVERVCVWANDKDLAQCVSGERVVQVDRRGMQIRDADGVRKKFGVEPALIPDLLALVGDPQDGYPGIPGIGRTTAARLLRQYGPIEAFPPTVLGEARERALLFKNLATLRTDAPLFKDVDELEWRGPTAGFAALTVEITTAPGRQSAVRPTRPHPLLCAGTLPRHLSQQPHRVPQLAVRQVGCGTEPEDVAAGIGRDAPCPEAPDQGGRDR
jgi:5'-3' exonuclease